MLTRIDIGNKRSGWKDENGKPITNATPLRCKCGARARAQICMRCLRCRSHCACSAWWDLPIDDPARKALRAQL